MQNGRVKAAYVVDRQGIAAAVSKMAFGNALGVTIEHNVDERDLFTPYIADLICEVPAEKVGELASTYTVIGEVTDKPVLSYKDTEITIREAVSAWTNRWKKYSRPYPVQSFRGRCPECGSSRRKRNCCRQLLSGKEHPRMLPQAGTADRIHSGLPGNEL